MAEVQCSWVRSKVWTTVRIRYTTISRYRPEKERRWRSQGEWCFRKAKRQLCFKELRAMPSNECGKANRMVVLCMWNGAECRIVYRGGRNHAVSFNRWISIHNGLLRFNFCKKAQEDDNQNPFRFTIYAQKEMLEQNVINFYNKEFVGELILIIPYKRGRDEMLSHCCWSKMLPSNR